MNVTVTDPLIDSGNPIPGPDSGDANNDMVLDLDETWIYTALYPITQQNINDGNVMNQATATGTDENGNMDTDLSDDDSPLEDDPTDTPLDQTPSISIVKTGVYSDTNNDMQVNVGDMIDYTFTVTNTGNVPLSNVTVTDPLIDGGAPIAGPDSGDANNDGILDLTETWIYTASLAITEANITDGFVTNQATATGDDPDGDPTSDMSDDDSPLENDPSVTPLPGIAIVKQGTYEDTDASGDVSVGDMINYVFTVTNQGMTPLENVTVTDPLIDGGAPITGPDSGDANNDGILDIDETWIYTVAYPITAENIADGSVTNQATATGTPVGGGDPVSDMSDDNDPLENDPTVTLLPGISLVKIGIYNDANANGIADVGDTIDYTFTVTNSGATPLSNVILTDPRIDMGNPIPGPDSGDTGNDDVLGLTEVWIYTASYDITQADLDLGTIENQAFVQGEDPDGNITNDVSDDDSPVQDEPTVTLIPRIAIVKMGTYEDTDLSGDVSVGDMINYVFTVTNTGTAPLENVTVVDPLIDGGTPIAGPDSGDTNLDDILDLDEIWIYTAAYEITANDITAGSVTNQATATGTPVGGGDPVSDMSDDNDPLENDPTVTELPMGAIAIVKESVLDDPNGDGFAEVGDIITYTFTVINTGNVPLSNIQITDPLPGLSAITFVDGDLNNDTILDLDEIWTYTATYSLTQDDINNGNVTNQAVVTGMTPNGETPTDSSDNNSPIEDDPTDTPIRQNGAIAVVKTAISGDSDNDGISEVGDLITYTFIVTNEGNVPLENIVLIDDLITQAGGSVDYVSGDENNDDILDLDESWTYTAMYTITQADIDAGEVVNQAIASGETPLQTVVDDDSDNDSPLEDEPTIVVFESPPCTLTRIDIKEGASKVVTPNGDSFNEFFTIPNSADCDYTYGVMIFNRWGNKVFENREDYNDEWNGFSQNSFVGGDQLPSGTYYYVIEVKNTDFEPITGFIFLGTK